MTVRRMVAIVALAVMATAGGAHAQERVIGGIDAPVGAWPSIVALTDHGVRPFDAQFCGGTLVDPSWVVTAAHCTYELTTGQPLPPSAIDAVVGVTALSSLLTAATPNQIPVDQIVRHPAFVNNDLFRDDIALLHLATPATAAVAGVATSDLPAPHAASTTAGRVAGWGLIALTPTPLAGDRLQQADVELLPDAACSAYGALYDATLMRCAGRVAGGVDACNGDSGGPLLDVGLPAGPLVGIVSFGNGCAEAGFPGVYTRTSAFRSFVYSTIGVLPPGPVRSPRRVDDPSPGVEWTPPASTGGRPITTYTVSAFRGATPVARAVVDGAATGVRFPALATGRRYGFTIVPSSVAGDGTGATLAMPRLTVVSTRTPRVTQSLRLGLTRIGLRIAAERDLRISIRVIDHRGRALSVRTASSRIDGRVPARNGAGLRGRLNAASTHLLTIAVATPKTPTTTRTIRILITVTSTLGERASRVVTARARL